MLCLPLNWSIIEGAKHITPYRRGLQGNSLLGVKAIDAQSPRARPPERESLRACLALFLLVIASFLASCVGGPGRGERQINYELTHQFAVEDPQFLRSMGNW